MTHDPGALHTALAGCGMRLSHWHAIMTDIELTWFLVNVAEPVAHLPVSTGGDIPTSIKNISSADAAVGFYRVHAGIAPLPDADELQRAAVWAHATNFNLFIHDSRRGDVDATV